MATKTKIPQPYVPTEAEEQTQLFNWSCFMMNRYPELELMYHIPNGGSRNKIEAANLKRQGVKSGVPDICLPVPRGGYHGLYIEMKRTKDSTVSQNQKAWLKKLSAQGYACHICKGWQAAAEVIQKYIQL